MTPDVGRPYLHLATSEMQRRTGGRELLIELSLCYSIVYYYDGAHCYKQFFLVA